MIKDKIGKRESKENGFLYSDLGQLEKGQQNWLGGKMARNIFFLLNAKIAEHSSNI
jgi:hypothetical protein